MKKVLLTASSYEHVLNFHIPYLEAFRQHGWETHAVAAKLPRDLPGADRAIDLPFRKQGNVIKNLTTVLRLRHLIRKERYDLIITHTTLGAFLTRLAVLFMPKRPRLVYMCHGYLFSPDMPWHKNLLLRFAERITAPVTDLLLTMNQYDYQAARKHRYSRHIESVPGIGVDFSAFDHTPKTDRKRLRQTYGIPERAVVLIYAAEFSGRKCQQILIDAMELLPEDVYLALPGAGRFLEECAALAAKYGNRVIFPGYVEDTAPWYAMADIAVTSSRSEGLPFNVMEAMHMGLPVVASAVKGHVDLITENETGLLYPYGASAACAEKILRLIADPDLQKKLSAGAKAMIGRYSLKNVMPVVMEQYFSILSGDMVPSNTSHPGGESNEQEEAGSSV